jgi:hypothetical protein
MPELTIPYDGPPPQTVIVVGLMDNGQLLVNAPMQNPMLALGMLEAAKSVILKQAERPAESSRIQPATSVPAIPPMLRKGNGGR